jgi:hypothetical protein
MATGPQVYQPRRPVRYRSVSPGRGYVHCSRPVRHVQVTQSASRLPRSAVRHVVVDGRGCCGECRQVQRRQDHRRYQSHLVL